MYKYRVLCEDKARYETATSRTWTNYEEAKQYADTISPSRNPIVVVEVNVMIRNFTKETE